MPRRARPVPKDRLQTLYAEKGLSIAAVAHHTGTTIDAVRRSLLEHGIAVRSASASRRIRGAG